MFPVGKPVCRETLGQNSYQDRKNTRKKRREKNNSKCFIRYFQVFQYSSPFVTKYWKTLKYWVKLVHLSSLTRRCFTRIQHFPCKNDIKLLQYICNHLTDLMPLVYFYTPWKHQKTRGILMSSKGLEKDKWN